MKRETSAAVHCTPSHLSLCVPSIGLKQIVVNEKRLIVHVKLFLKAEAQAFQQFDGTVVLRKQGCEYGMITVGIGGVQQRLRSFKSIAASVEGRPKSKAGVNVLEITALHERNDAESVLLSFNRTTQ